MMNKARFPFFSMKSSHFSKSERASERAFLHRGSHHQTATRASTEPSADLKLHLPRGEQAFRDVSYLLLLSQVISRVDRK